VRLAPAPLHLIFGLPEASVKIGGSAFVSSNSENISCVTFLKHKNSRKQRIYTNFYGAAPKTVSGQQ
jgi:hypothetical protein